MISLAIIGAGILIGGALIWLGGAGSSLPSPKQTASVSAREPAPEFRLPNEADHVRGNPNAPVSIIEFSDLECPFCARLHPTLTAIIEKNSEVKWIYRHFPLSSIHSRAEEAAAASECVARLSGNAAFWDFADKAFQNQRRLGSAFYEEIAKANGVNLAAFSECTNGDDVAGEIQADLNEVVRAGGRGTPYVVIVTKSGKLVPFSGALPYDSIQSLIDQAFES